MTMTSRQRIATALSHREPDRTPTFEYVLLSPLADQFLGRVYAGDPSNWDAVVAALGWEGAVQQSAADQAELALLLGHDMLYAIPNPAPPSTTPHAPADPLPADPVEAMRCRNERAAQAPPIADDNLLVYTRVKDEMRRYDVDLPVLAPAYVHGVWTDVELMQTMALAPDVAHEHFALCTRRALAQIDKYVALGIDLIGVGGDFAGQRSIISPRMYREFMVPEVRVVSRRVHAAGLHAVNASDGNLWPVIDDFLLGTEVDAYLEIDMYAGMDLGALKQRFGSRITFFGNMDCGNTLTFGSPELIRAQAIACLQAGQGNGGSPGGHIFCASNAITASVSMENYLAMLNAYRDYFGLLHFSLDETQ
jgi:uroporphyrinogen decarboxylase